MVKRYLCLWVAILLIFSMLAVAACKPIAPNDPVQPIDPDTTVLSKLTVTNVKVTNAEGKEVNDIVYNKAALDKAVEKIMKDQGALNFKYIQEVTTNEAK